MVLFPSASETPSLINEFLFLPTKFGFAVAGLIILGEWTFTLF